MISTSKLINKFMKEQQIIIGIDVSKLTLDACVWDGQAFHSRRIDNSLKSIASFLKQLQKKFKDTPIKIAIENTGYYNWPFYEAVKLLQANVYVINPLHLHKSLGMVRGKNDQVDAQRIAKYLMLHIHDLKPTVLPRTQIRHLQALVAQRKRLMDIRTKLMVPAKELELLGNKTITEQVMKSTKQAVKSIDIQIAVVEKQIDSLIVSDEDMQQQFRYITSVQGVGKVLAWAMIIKTNEFKSINNPRKLACFAGVVPFEHSSGTSIQRRPKVSYMADKTLKKLLHLAAMRAIQLNGDMRNYYMRKVEEGKNKMSALNAVRNKIVARICSCVNNNKFYTPDLNLS